MGTTTQNSAAVRCATQRADTDENDRSAFADCAPIPPPSWLHPIDPSTLGVNAFGRLSDVTAERRAVEP